MKRLVAGIDAGGTNLRIRFSSEDGKTLAEVQGRACVDYGPENISQIISSSDISADDVCVVYAGVAGISRLGMRQRWSAELERLFPKAAHTLVPDYTIAFHGALAQSGILVIAGTGSIVYGEFQDKQVRVGGRGWEWGDWGSGTWITSEILRTTLCSFDGMAKRTQLVERVCSHMGTSDPLKVCELARKLCEEQGRGFLVPVALAGAEAGDEDALNLFEKAGQWLAAQVDAAAQQLGMSKNEPFKVATVGGLWDCGEPLLSPFARCLKQTYDGVLVNKPLSEPIEGAVRQAISMVKQVSA